MPKKVTKWLARKQAKEQKKKDLLLRLLQILQKKELEKVRSQRQAKDIERIVFKGNVQTTNFNVVLVKPPKHR